MTSTYSSTGVTYDRYADILTRLIALSVAQWGESIDTSEDEYLGHTLRNVALLTGELNQVSQDIYDATSVANSSGARTAALIELIGLERLAAAYSTVTLSLTATIATTVPAGKQYKTLAGVVFSTDVPLVFAGAGTSTVAATCTVVGANEAAIGDVSVIVTPYHGISTVTNAAAATPGRDQETTAEMKARHTAAVATSGEDDLAGTVIAVSEVTGVSATYGFENDTNEAIGVVPAHTIRISAIGGTDALVAAAISNNKTSGVPTYGATTVSVYNPTTKQAKNINLDRAVATTTHVSFTVATIEGVFPDDGADQLKAALVAHYDGISIDDNVIYSALYNPIYSIAGITAVTLLKLDIIDAPVGVIDLVSTPLLRYTLETGDIDVTVT